VFLHFCVWHPLHQRDGTWDNGDSWKTASGIGMSGIEIDHTYVSVKPIKITIQRVAIKSFFPAYLFYFLLSIANK